MKRIVTAIVASGLACSSAYARHYSHYTSHTRSAELRHAGFARHGWADDATSGQGSRSFTAKASWYGGGPKRYEPNTHTASGERFNAWGLTAAHRTLPLGTKLLVSHNGRSCVVRINDRGPAAWTGRTLDLSKGAASHLGMIGAGQGRVHVTVLGDS